MLHGCISRSINAARLHPMIKYISEPAVMKSEVKMRRTLNTLYGLHMWVTLDPVAVSHSDTSHSDTLCCLARQHSVSL